jgi:hypothetical protein
MIGCGVEFDVLVKVDTVVVVYSRNLCVLFPGNILLCRKKCLGEYFSEYIIENGSAVSGVKFKQ